MAAPRSVRVEAVVLRQSDWGEADRLVHLFTRERGKLRAIAKGVRRMHSRKAGHLQPFTRVALLLARGRDLWIVTQAETVDAYLELRDDLLRTGYAAYVVELLDRFTYEEGANPALYRLLVESLQRVASEPDAFPAVRYYELRLLDVLGYRPRLFECTACQKTIKPQDQFFSAGEGGVLCPKCGPRFGGAKPVSLAALKLLRHYQRSSYAEACRATLSASVRNEMESLLQHYLTHLLERSLNVPEFLRQVRRTPQD